MFRQSVKADGLGADKADFGRADALTVVARAVSVWRRVREDLDMNGKRTNARYLLEKMILQAGLQQRVVHLRIEDAR